MASKKASTDIFDADIYLKVPGIIYIQISKEIDRVNRSRKADSPKNIVLKNYIIPDPHSIEEHRKREDEEYGRRVYNISRSVALKLEDEFLCLDDYSSIIESITRLVMNKIEI